MTKLKKIILAFALLLVLVPSAIFLASCGCTPVPPEPEPFSIIGDWKLEAIVLVEGDEETRINVGEDASLLEIEGVLKDNFATLNFSETKVNIGGAFLDNYDGLNYTKEENILTTETYNEGEGKFRFTLLEDNKIKMENLFYDSETEDFIVSPIYVIMVKGKATQPEGPVKEVRYSLAPNIFGEEASLEGFSAELVLFSDGTYSFTQTESYNYLEETSLIEGNWSLNNGQKKLISITKYAKINKLVGNIISEEEYEGDAAYAEVYNDFDQSFLSEVIINENLVMIIMSDMPPLVNEEAGNIIFTGGMLKLYGINFDFFIHLDPDNEWTEESIFGTLFSEDAYDETEGMYSVGVITRDGFEEYHLIYNNIRFGEIAIGAEGETTDLKAWLTLPGDTVETEITLKCYFASEPPAEFMNVRDPLSITYNNSIDNEDQVLKGTTLADFIAGIEIGTEDDNRVPMTEDMVEGWPAAGYTGWETIKITYQGLNDYYRLYFYDNEITTVISSGINEEVVVEKGQDLTEAISSLEAYVEFTGNTNDSISSNVNYKWFDLSEAELTVEGLTIEEGKITDTEGTYLVTFKVTGASYIYNNYWDEETQQQIDEVINIPDFEITAVVVVVDKNDPNLEFVTEFDIEGEILGTDNGDSENDTLDLNGAKLKVYFNNDSENPTIIDIDESMVTGFSVDDGSQWLTIHVGIKYTYEYKGVEYTLIYFYQKDTPKQYTIRFVYDDNNGTETEISSITEDYNTEIFLPTKIEGHPELIIINWESNNPNYSVWQDDEEGFRTFVSDSDVTFTAVFETQEQSDPIEGMWVFEGAYEDSGLQTAVELSPEGWEGSQINALSNNGLEFSYDGTLYNGSWSLQSENNYDIELSYLESYSFDNGFINLDQNYLVIEINDGYSVYFYKFMRP